MASEGTPSLASLSLHPTELKGVDSTTGGAVDTGVSASAGGGGRPMMMSSNISAGATPFYGNANNKYNNNSPYNTNYNNNNPYYGNPTNFNNQQQQQQYTNNGYGGGGGYNSYNRDYTNSNYNPNAAGNSNNTYGNANNNNSGDTAAANVPDDGSVVDSALLAALRDSRERVALLRLEQVMIDFMNAPEGYLEVGGPYNSVVVSPNTSSKRFQNQNSASLNSSNDGPRQTSFQRCLLHRLADRFGIVRENGTILDGSIRLIKQKESKKPKMLLLDHVEESNKLASNSNSEKGDPSDSRSSSFNNGGGGDDSQQPTATAATPTKEKTKRKMKIMKRQSSQDSGNGQAKTTPKSRKNKNFTDKEKAYAEARARIFADEAATANNSATASPADASAPSSSAPSPSVTPPPHAPTSNSAAPSSGGQSSAAPVHRSSSNGSLGMPKRMSSSSLTAGAGGGDPTDGDNNNNLPPAASSGVSKATWRNRREEENDPDFQRGAGLQTHLMPAAHTAAPAYGVHAAQHAMGVPHAGNVYYYGGPAGAVPAGYAHPQHAQQQPPLQPYQHHPYGAAAVADYSNAGRGGVGGGRMPNNNAGRGFVSTPRGGYGYPQQQQQLHPAQTYQSASGKDATNVNSMDEFPALR